MSIRLQVTSLLSLACACTPAPTCPKGTVRTVPTSVYAVEGAASLDKLVFPGPRGCELPEGTLSAAGTYTEPDGTSSPLDVVRLAHKSSDGTVTVDVSFVPKRPGQGEFRLLVEPSLGLAQVPVFVAQDGSKLPAVDERSCQPAITGHTVCVTDAGVELRFQGMATQTLPDTLAPQVVGPVLWVETKATALGAVIERHVLSAAGPVVESRRSVAVSSSTAGVRFADETVAVRRGVLVTLDGDGGLVTTATPYAASADALTVEEQRVFSFTADRWCEVGGSCFPISARTKLAGLQREVWWESVASELNARRRPVGDGGVVATVPITATVAAARRDLNGVVRPAWQQGEVGLLVAEWLPDAGIALWRFPHSAAPSFQSPDFIGFALDGGVTRYYRLR